MTKSQPQLLKLPPIPRARKNRPCKYCSKTARRRGRLCQRHHRMWLDGHPGISPDLTRAAAPPPRCTECDDFATSKGLCPKHYSRMRRQANPPRCTLPYCEDPRQVGDRLYCIGHANCVADACDERFKARRLCAKHYQTIYLAPRDRVFLNNLIQKNAAQQQLFQENDPTNQQPDNAKRTPAALVPLPDHTPFLFTPGAPPLHTQAGCPRDQAQEAQECADAIALLQNRGVLPPNAAQHAQARTSRILSNRLARTSPLQEVKA